MSTSGLECAQLVRSCASLSLRNTLQDHLVILEVEQSRRDGRQTKWRENKARSQELYLHRPEICCRVDNNHHTDKCVLKNVLDNTDKD